MTTLHADRVAKAGLGGGTYPPSGSLLIAGSNWLSGEGVNVYSNGEDGNPNGVYQCVELVNRLITTRGWSPSIYGNANQFYADANSNYFVKHPNGSGYLPVEGDVVVWGGGEGGWGHVAVVDADSGGLLTVVEQNASPIGYGTYKISSSGYIAASAFGYYVEGYLHPKADTIGGPTPTPSPAPTPSPSPSPSPSTTVTVSLSGLSANGLGVSGSVSATAGADTVSDCGLMVNGTSVAQGSCGTLSTNVALYNTSYSVSGYADVSGVGRVNSSSTTVTTPLKPLVADATINWGPSGWNNQPYAGPTSHAFSTPNFVAGSGTPVDNEPTLYASCATNGGNVINDGYGGAESSTIWVDIPAYGSTPWMSTLYFNIRGTGAANNLPAC